jgi:alkanesulfonate monooxygenase SsuD/methylene tetrahydromethanopterin reductase-like flavin-dependent oxidoreductase (luciferase family)
MLDQMSRGRLQLGIGRGAVFIEQRLYGFEPDEIAERYGEAIEILFQALGKGEVRFSGKFYNYPNFPMVLQPYQAPHPPLWYGINNPASTAWAAANGVNVVSLAPARVAAAIMSRYREEWDKLAKPAADLPCLGLARHVVVAETDAEAKRIAAAAFVPWRASMAHLWEKMNAHHPLLDAMPHNWAAFEAKGDCIAGTPATVRDYLARESATAGANYFACHLVFGTMHHEDAIRSLELFAREVMPAFAGTAAPVPA